MNNLRQARAAVYRLKRQFGQTVGLYNLGSVSNSITTGKSYTTYNIYRINRACVMPAQEARKFEYDLSYIAGNKNFTYGAFYDTSERAILIDRRDMDAGVTIDLDSSIIFDKGRHQVKQVMEVKGLDSYLLLVKDLKSDDAFDPQVVALIDAGWDATDSTIIALDELCRNVRINVFSDSVPDDFFLWPCCGKALADALYTVWHPDGNATTVTNSGFVAADYQEQGRIGGFTGDGVSYLDTGWSPDSATISDFHASVFGADFDDEDTKIIGSDADLVLQVSGTDLQFVEQTVELDYDDDYEKGHIAVSAKAANELVTYFNGVEDTTDATVRTGTLPSTDVRVFGLTSGFTTARICTVSLGKGLTGAQMLSLYTAIQTFNLKLGRGYE